VALAPAWPIGNIRRRPLRAAIEHSLYAKPTGIGWKHHRCLLQSLRSVLVEKIVEPYSFGSAIGRDQNRLFLAQPFGYCFELIDHVIAPSTHALMRQDRMLVEEGLQRPTGLVGPENEIDFLAPCDIGRRRLDGDAMEPTIDLGAARQLLDPRQGPEIE